MSVCIAAICTNGDRPDNRIIAITDRKGSWGDFSNEDAGIKGLPLNRNWVALFAGNDVSPCVPILRKVALRLSGEPSTLETYIRAFESAYQEELSDLAAAEVLGRWKLDMSTFRTEGRKQFGSDVFDTLCDQIQRVKLQCKFLVFGFDENTQPHIFVVRNPGVVEVKDTPGYWAIGNGAYAAMSTLGFFKQNVITRLEKTIYQVCAAKFMAETASDVGRSPFMWFLAEKGRGITWPPDDLIRVVRNAWTEQGTMKIPNGILDSIKSMLPAPEE